MKKGSILFVIFAIGLCIWALPAEANLIVNWSFEDPDVDDGDYDLLPSIPGWNRLTTDAPAGWGNGNYIEVQDHWLPAWDAKDGAQLCELDSGIGAGSTIYQDIATLPGQSYLLQLWYSPRPRTAAIENVLGIMWDGVIIDDTISASGLGLTSTVWTPYEYTLTASSSTTRLAFGVVGGLGNGVGTFIDAVSLEPIQAPAPIPEPATILLVGSGLIGLAGLRKKFKI